MHIIASNYEEKKRELANLQFNSKTTKERKSNNALKRPIKEILKGIKSYYHDNYDTYKELLS